jgi:phage protein U
MLETMMALGAFRFCIETAAYDELFTTQDFEWAEQPIIGGPPELQYVGKSAKLRQFKGTIYTTFRGGIGQIEAMRVQAALAIPLLLVAGTGAVLGFWVITHIEHTETVFFADGMPMKVQFNIQIKQHGELLPLLSI